MSAASKRNILLICLATLVCGLGHVFFYSRLYFDEFSRLFCGAVSAVWGLSVHKRVTNRRIRRLLLAMVCFFLFYLLLQTINYDYAQDVASLRRLAWYGYYLCMMSVAILLYEISFSLSPVTVGRKRFLRWLLPVLGVALTLGILTNDLHFLAFRFQAEEALPGSPVRYGPLFFLFFACFALLLSAAFLIIQKKQRQILKKNRFLTFLPLLVLALFLVLDALGRSPRIAGIKLWQQGEMYSFCMMAFLELCIAAHMIPANTDYEKLFALSRQPAVILDEKGRVVYATQAASYPFPDQEDTLVLRHPIAGGSIVWAVDVAPLNALNQALAETAQRIEARNAYLSEEAKIKKEKAETEERNLIYEKIMRVVRPQLAQISEKLEEPEKTFDEQLPAISVLCAYIKRRSNLELLAAKGTLAFEELGLAIRESLSYAGTLGIRTASSAVGTGIYPAELVISAYEQAEAVLESCLDSATDLMILTKAGPGSIFLRILLRAGALTLPIGEAAPASLAYRPEVSVTKEEEDLILSFTFREGGADG